MNGSHMTVTANTKPTSTTVALWDLQQPPHPLLWAFDSSMKCTEQSV